MQWQLLCHHKISERRTSPYFYARYPKVVFEGASAQRLTQYLFQSCLTRYRRFRRRAASSSLRVNVPASPVGCFGTALAATGAARHALVQSKCLQIIDRDRRDHSSQTNTTAPSLFSQLHRGPLLLRYLSHGQACTSRRFHGPEC
jgi:hypothetical protein